MFRANAAMVGILTVSSVLVASNLRADEKEDLYNEAVRLNDNNQFKEAAELFRKVQQLDKTFKYHYNVGQCEYKAKRYGPAIESFKKFLAGVHKGKTLKKARKHALEVIKELTPLVGFLEIQGEQSVEVWVDDTLRGTTPLTEPVLLAEGKHVVVVKDGDKVIDQRTVHIKKTKTTQLTVLQGVDADAKAEFNRGIALYNAGLFAEAATAFRKANVLKPAWPLLFNIGQSEAAAKRYGLAYESFQEYLSLGGDEIPSARQSLVEQELTRLEGLVGNLKIIAPKGVTVLINGTVRGKTPLPGKLKVAVGVIHTVKITHGGKAVLTKKVKVSRGETSVIDTRDEDSINSSYSVSAGKNSNPITSSVTRDKNKRASTMLWTGLAGTLVFACASGATWGVAVSKMNAHENTVNEIDTKMNTWDFSRPEDDHEEQELRGKMTDLEKEGTTFNRVAIAMTAATGVFVALTVVGQIFRKSSKKPSQKQVEARLVGLEVRF